MLNDQEQHAMVEFVKGEQGCPCRVTDRLEAFEAGVIAAVVAMTPLVSMDPQEE